MKLVRLTLMGTLGLLVIGCARQSGSSSTDTTAMMVPATPSPAVRDTIVNPPIVVVEVREIECRPKRVMASK